MKHNGNIDAYHFREKSRDSTPFAGTAFPITWDPRRHGSVLTVDLSQYSASAVEGSLELNFDPTYDAAAVEGEELTLQYVRYPGGPIRVDGYGLVPSYGHYSPVFAPVDTSEALTLRRVSSVSGGWLVLGRRGADGLSGLGKLERLLERNAYNGYVDLSEQEELEVHCISNYAAGITTVYGGRYFVGGMLRHFSGTNRLGLMCADEAGVETAITLPYLGPGFTVTGVTMYGSTGELGALCLGGGGSSATRVLLSTDGGSTWALTAGSLPSSVNALHGVVKGLLGGDDTLLVYERGYQDHIYLSSNGGASWSAETLPASGDVIQRVLYTGGIFVAVGYNGTGGRVWRRNSGPAGSGTWTAIWSGGAGTRLYDIYSRMAVGENGVILHSSGLWSNPPLQRSLLKVGGVPLDCYRVTKLQSTYVVAGAYTDPTTGVQHGEVAVSPNSGASFFTEPFSPVRGPFGVSAGLQPIHNRRILAFRSAGVKSLLVSGNLPTSSFLVGA